MLNICNKIKELRRKKLCKKQGDAYSFHVFNNTSEIIVKDWNYVVKEQDFFLQLPYLSLMQSLHHEGIQFRYVIVYKNPEPVLVVYFQVNDFTAEVFGELLDGHLGEIQSKRKRLFSHYLDHKKKDVVMRLLTCGNNFVSGQHGMASAGLNIEEAFELLENVLNLIGKREKLRGKISATLVKDFYESNFTYGLQTLSPDKFTRFYAEPNMFVHIPEGIETVNNYIALFSKKYRNRAKAILKTGEPLQRRQLDAAETEKYNTQLYQLYEEVYNHATFKLVKLNARYFSETKKNFPNQFFVNGYFLNNKLVAFDSGFILINKKTIEAHYIGVNYSLHKEFEIYQNILYGYIETSLAHNFHLLNLGRTASEIKSTVGAGAENLICFFRPQNTVSKLVLKPFVSFLQPNEWIPRNPFKEV